MKRARLVDHRAREKGTVLTNKHWLMEQGPEAQAQEEDEGDQARETDEPHPAAVSLTCALALSVSASAQQVSEQGLYTCTPARPPARACIYIMCRAGAHVRAFQQEVDRSNGRKRIRIVYSRRVVSTTPLPFRLS